MTAFHIRLRFSPSTPRQVHRAFGLVAACLLTLEAFTGLWLCFPQTMRGILTAATPVSEDVRPARAPRGKAASGRAGLGELIAAANHAIPEGNGNVQIRMWRPTDFRSLGNNVVYLSSSTAQVLATDLYSDRPTPNRFIQAMAGLHYDEWGGLPFRVLCALAGLVTPLLYLTGFLIWWYSRNPQTKKKQASQPALNHSAAVVSNTR